MAKHSGLQQQVLALYRSVLRVARSKDVALAKEAGAAAGRTHEGANYQFVRDKFRSDASSVGRMNFAVIEHLLRKGQKDLKLLERVKNAAFTRVPR